TCGKKVTGHGRGYVGHLGILEVYDGEMGCCILGLSVDGGFLARVEGWDPRMDRKGE
ncbi:hypothetical protein KI387_025474, partial [Taxus chinensis]